MYKWHRSNTTYSAYYLGNPNKPLGVIHKVRNSRNKTFWVGESNSDGKRESFWKARNAKAWVEEQVGIKVEKQSNKSYVPVKNKVKIYDMRNLKKHFPEVKGIAMGRCISTGRVIKIALAHAHIKGDRDEGWICFFGATKPTRGNKPSIQMLHEYAHLLTGQGHSPAWKREYRKLLKKFGYNNYTVNNRYD